MNYFELEQHIIDTIEEQQLKLGYLKETVRLYYPLSSLNRLMQTDVLAKEMLTYLNEFSNLTASRLGKLEISNEGERFCIAVPPLGVEYIRENLKTNGFLAELIDKVKMHGITFEDVLSIFYKYSKNVYVEHVENGEFDYLVYFEDGIPDKYCYCITIEEHHVTYHRYSKQDYEDFGF